MVRREIRDIKIQNLEVKLVKRLEVISLYIKFLILYPANREVRKQLLLMMEGFFKQFKEEKIILDRLNNAYISQEDFDRILCNLDEIFDEAWYYYEDILKDFEITLDLGDFDRVIYRKPEDMYLTSQKRDEFLEKIESLELESKNLYR